MTGLKNLDLRGNSNLDFANICVVFEDFPKDIIISTQEFTRWSDDNSIMTLQIPKQNILPVEIGRLRNLIGMSLEENYLTTLPTEIGNLKKLVKLNSNLSSMILTI